MKVYQLNYVSAGYGSGIILVAANSSDEALKIANVGYYNFEDPSDMSSTLQTTLNEPQIILEQVYQE